jgi:hypothetical protein
MNKEGNESTRVVRAKIINAGPLTPQNKALYEAGKTLLVDSIKTAREFCSTMIGISTGAIPVFFGILAIILPEHYVLNVSGGITLALPAIGFLAAVVIFIFGYQPIGREFSLDILDEIRAERNRIIRHRRGWIIAGVSVFSASTLLAIYAIIINIGVR